MCIGKKTQGHAEVLWPDRRLFRHNGGVSGTQLYFFRASSALCSVIILIGLFLSIRWYERASGGFCLLFSSIRKPHFTNTSSVARFGLEFHSKVSEMCFSPLLATPIYSIK